MHRSSSVASSGLSNANWATSDVSDKVNDAALCVKEVQPSSSSYTERSRTNRLRSTEIVPEFAPVREDSTGENSDAEMCVNPDSVDPSSHSTKDVTAAAGTVKVLPDRKVAELKQGGRNDKSIVSKGGGRTTAHVGFAA